MRVRTNDGMILYGETPFEITRALQKTSRSPGANLSEFRRATADRVMLQHGKRVRSHNDQVFVEDLIGHGLLIREEDA